MTVQDPARVIQERLERYAPAAAQERDETWRRVLRDKVEAYGRNPGHFQELARNLRASEPKDWAPYANMRDAVAVYNEHDEDGITVEYDRDERHYDWSIGC